MTNIIKVQFFKGGTPAGKAYSYSPCPAALILTSILQNLWIRTL